MQAPKNSQSLNRYSYVLNNPLSYTDPSGFALEGLLAKFVFDSILLFISHEINTAPSNEIEQKKSFNDFMPGTVVGAFGNGQQQSINDCVQGTALCGGAQSQRSADSYLEQTASNIMGETYSETSGRKFANGAATISHEVTTGYIDHGSSGTSMAVSAAEVLVPGYDLYQCSQSRKCTGVTIAIGVIGIIPAGKLAAIAGKGVVGVFRAAIKWRKARRATNSASKLGDLSIAGRQRGAVGPRKARQKSERMKSDDDALQQLEEIENAQRRVRQGKSNKIIDSIEKSKQRAKHQLDRLSIDDLDDLDGI